VEDRAQVVDVRCSVIVFRDDNVLLVHRARDGADAWVLPGGTPRPGESMAACARRETLEETGLSADPGRIAFVLEAVGPQGGRRVVDLVFLASDPVRGEPDAQEEGMEARFVPLRLLSDLALRPPIAGYLRGLHPGGRVRTAAYLGNLWRPERGDDMSVLPGASRPAAVE
jgi:8-oxo-dGTP diphosphatase